MMTTTEPEIEPKEPKASRLGLRSAQLLYITIVIILLVRPSTLFPVGGEQCDFCFREATGKLTYRGAQSGNVWEMSVCDSHRRSAPSSGTTSDFGYFKFFVWLFMLVPFGFAFVIFGRALFFSRESPPSSIGGFGCLTFTLIPMLIGQIVNIIGFHITGRVVQWLAIFLMVSAMMAIVTDPFMPDIKTADPETKADNV